MDENHDGGELAMRKISGNKMSYHNMPMSLFANVLAGAVDDTVVDGTGLKGGYDFTLEYYSGPGGVGRQRRTRAGAGPQRVVPAGGFAGATGVENGIAEGAGGDADGRAY